MANKRIIIVNGYPRAGKDTVVEYMSEAFREAGYETGELSSIAPVCDMLRDRGLDVDNKTPEMRTLLSQVKAALDKYNQYTTRFLAKYAFARALADSPMVIFFHIREPINITRLKVMLGNEQFTITTLFVDGPRADRTVKNASDQKVEKYAYDCYILNSGTLGQLHDECLKVADIYIQRDRSSQ